jgi:glycosyltransferase involved in cell wall biosynthesis
MTLNRLQDGPIRVLLLTPAIGETSAPYNELALAAPHRHSITICTYFPPTISVPEPIALFPGDGSLVGFFRALASALAAEEHDIIHAHLPSVSFLLAARAMVADRTVMCATVHTVHSSYANYKFRNRLMLLPVLALYHRVVFCSHSSLESFPRLYRLLVGSRACVIHNGVDLARIDRSIGDSPNHPENAAFRILTVGRLISLKKPLSILRAFHQAGDRAGRLVLVGEGDLKEEILAESNRLGLQNQVQITGLIEREEVYRHLVKADLFVSASTVEGLPVAVLEAMACRCPAILSDIPPHREIADGAGFIPLIRSDDVPGFAREMQRFRQMPRAERAAIGDMCREWVESRFSLTKMHEGYEKVYTQILDGR